MFGTRIVIAHADATYRRILKEEFRHNDYQLVGESTDARGVLQVVFQLEPHVVVMDPYLPGSESIDLTGIIDEHRVAPIVAIASYMQGEIEEYARLPGVYGVLLKPLQGGSVQPVIESAVVNFERTTIIEKELIDLGKELENRKIIEKAKGLLMERKKFTEKDAYKCLQKLSMDRCIPLVKVAKNIILHYEQSRD